jgi:hypothetical protein
MKKRTITDREIGLFLTAKNAQLKGKMQPAQTDRGTAGASMSGCHHPLLASWFAAEG